jgi:aspartate carbamoyltransferase catalytic subunit
MLKHILTTEQFSDRGRLNDIFSESDRFHKADQSPSGKIRKTLHDQIIASVFYEPSTRTRFSFEAAAFKLGANVLTSENAGEFSSAVKGESIEDSTRVIGGYADMIVIRHPKMGAAKKAAEVSKVPIINAGDGIGEHPTQAVLDLYTIQRELGTIDDLKIALVGDLLNGRTIHSLVRLLSKVPKNPYLYLASPPQLRLPEKYLDILNQNNISYEITRDFETVLPESDIVYFTRVQKERFVGKKQRKLYKKLKNDFIFDHDSLDIMKPEARLMHPLPRVNEITEDVDTDPRAAYFRQAENGLYVRMCLLEMLNESKSKK